MLLIFLFLLLGLLIMSLSSKEGFDTGEYAYLAPSAPLVLDAATQTRFVNAFNNSGKVAKPDVDLSNENTMNSIKNSATLDEINYYIENKQWPYNRHIMDYINANKDELTKTATTLKLQSNDDFQKLFNTRSFYSLFMFPNENALSPKPISVGIFLGKETPPSGSSVPSTIKPLSDDNYTKLKSICSTL